MSKNNKVAVVVGSLRKQSVNRKAALALSRMAADNLEFDFIEISDLPHYNEDLDNDLAPEAWTRFREQLSGADAVLFVTPEYNRSVPGALKNAIDVGSRPYGESAWAKKPAAVMTLSPGGIGGFGANHHLRQSLVFLDMPVLQQPEAYVGSAYEIFDDQGEITNDRTRAFFQKFIDAFAEWIERVAH